MDSRRFPSGKAVAATVVLSAFAAALTSLSHPAALRVDGRRMASDVPPVTTARGAYVPLRVVAESFGADTNYDAKTRSIEVVRADDTLRLRVGERTATLNGKRLTLKAAPFAVRGRTLVPLGVIAQAFKTKVRYDGARAAIDVVTTPRMPEPGSPGDAP